MNYIHGYKDFQCTNDVLRCFERFIILYPIIWYETEMRKKVTEKKMEKAIEL